MISRFSIIALIFLSVGHVEEINWQTEEQVDIIYEENPRDVFLLYSADWCASCISLKKFLNKHADKLNDKMYFIYKDCTNQVLDNVDTYPRSYIYTTSGNTIMLEGKIKDKKLKSLLELN